MKRKEHKCNSLIDVYANSTAYCTRFKLTCNSLEAVWKVPVPLRVVVFFVWSTVLGKVLTADNLCRHGMVMVRWCYLCQVAAKSIDHLFLHCLFARVL